MGGCSANFLCVTCRHFPTSLIPIPRSQSMSSYTPNHGPFFFPFLTGLWHGYGFCPVKCWDWQVPLLCVCGSDEGSLRGNVRIIPSAVTTLILDHFEKCQTTLLFIPIISLPGDDNAIGYHGASVGYSSHVCTVCFTHDSSSKVGIYCTLMMWWRCADEHALSWSLTLTSLTVANSSGVFPPCNI